MNQESKSICKAQQSESQKQRELPFTKLLKGQQEEMVELNLTNEQTKAILATASDSFWVTDGKTRKFVQANKAYCQWLGYSLDELREMTLDDIDPLLTDEEKSAIIAKIVENGGARFETKHRHKDGRLLDIEISVTFNLESGLLYCFGRDISDRKRMEDKLNESLEISRRNSERFKALFDNSGDAIFMHDLQGNILSANLECCSRYGYSSEEILQIHISSVDGEKRPDLIGDRMDRVLSGNRFVFETIHQTKSGELFPVEVAARKVTIEEESFILATCRDISERKQVEDELKESYALLSVAKEEADAASRAKSEFLANMSHEIRTPMNAIIGMSHLAMRTELTPTQRDYIKKIHTSGNNLLTIINNILDISKVESGKMVLDFSEFALDNVLENVVDLIAEKAGAKNLELTFDIEKSVPPTLIGDSLRLGQILINYAYNAVKFTNEGEISFQVRVVERTKLGVLLYFAVRDTGIGLSEDQKKLLFQNFNQADASITRKYGGTGLGLAIAKQFSELMGGEVGVKSEPGEGSTFWFTARLGIGNEILRNLLPEEELRGRRVLVVDDSTTARQIVSDMLMSMSFVVNEAASGKMALEALLAAEEQGKPYEIVFLDWRMPQMDGIETFHRINSLGLSAMPHVIMLTAYGREEVLKTANDAGIEYVLIKPVSASSLFNSIMQVLGGQAVSTDHHYDATSAVEVDFSSISGAEVLLVEDNDYNQDVATELLKIAGCKVDLAEHGEIAVRKVQEKQYDIVFMDVQMPVMDGYSATIEIRRLPYCANLPIVAMTANAMQSDREKCLKAGMNDYIAKPIDPEKLWKALLKWIKPHSAKMEIIPAEVATVSSVALPSGISGLDIEVGLIRVLGNSNLYISLLKKFMAGNQDTAKNIRKALQEGDFVTAERIAHTLKGVSAGLGAMPLHDLSDALETAFRANKTSDELTALLTPLEAVLDELLDELKKQPVLETSKKALVIVDPDKLKYVCQRLKLLLEDNDSEAADLLEENSDLLEAAFGEQCGDIKAGVADFDFDKALRALVRTMATL